MENIDYILNENNEFSFHTLELKKRITSGEYYMIKNRLYLGGHRVFIKNNKIESHEFKIIGVIIYLSHSGKNYFVSLRINPRRLLGDENYFGIFVPHENNVEKLIAATSNLLEFVSLGGIEEYKLKRLDFCRNIVMETPMADDYMNLINRSRCAYSFKKEYYELDGKKDKDGVYFRSRLLEVYIYQKTKQLKKIGLLEDQNQFSDTAVLRIEIRFNRNKIRELENRFTVDSLKSLLIDISQHSKNSFESYVPRLFFSGQYKNFADGIYIIKNSRFQERTKQLMITLYTESSKKHNLGTALEYISKSNNLNERKLREILNNFDEIDLNPIPLNQRCFCGRNNLQSIPIMMGLKKEA